MTMKTSFRRRSSDPSQRLLLFVDNTTLNAGAGGDVIATDDIGGVKYQIVKTTLGPLDSQTIASSGSGTVDAGTQRVILASDQDPVEVGGGAAENAAVSGNPVLSAGRYDATPRVLDDGDAGALALDVNGHIITSPHADTITLGDDVSNTVNVQVDRDDAFMVNATFPYYFDGTAWDRIRGDSTNGMYVQAKDIIPGVGATNLGKAEDAAHSSGDTGVMGLGVRTDVPASTAADGDYVPFLMSEEGALWTENLPSEVESGNSSTSTLLADAVFTGTGVDLLDHQTVTVMIDASHDSATDGMQFQFSSDDSSWDVSLDFTYTATEGGRIFQFGIYARYFRVLYTNGGTGQTHFRCQTLLHHETTLTTIHRLVDDASPDRSAEIVKSAIIAQAAGSGDFVPVQATAAGNFKISVQEISDGLDIGAGNAGSETQRVSISTDDVNLAAQTTSLALIDNPIVAHDAAISGSTGVNVIGARAVASVEGQTETAAADASQINATLSGNLITQSQVAPEELVSFYVANTDGAEDAVTGLDAGGAGIHNYITAVTISNSHATTGATVRLLAGSAGSVWWEFPAPANFGGVTMNFSPPLKQPTANQALYVDPSAAVTTLGISIQGYQGQG